MRHLALMMMLVLLPAGCASLSEDQCRAGDWYAIGVADGAAGRSADFLTSHAKACAEYGIAPNRAEWLRGRTSGLALYCTPENAYTIGRTGLAPNPVCPASAQPAMDRASRQGMRYHEIGRDIDEAANRMAGLRAEIAALPPGDPGIGPLRTDLSALAARINMLSARRMLYSTWP